MSRLCMKNILAIQLRIPFRYSLYCSSINISTSIDDLQWTTQSIVPHSLEISAFHQKGFSIIADINNGKSLHAFLIKNSAHLTIFHTNTLINMYCKFGKARYARIVFDTMLERNSASWNNMISGYVRDCFYDEGVMLFMEMRVSEFEINGYVVASVLTAINRLGDLLVEGLKMHGLVLKSGLVKDVFVGTSILHFYGVYKMVLNSLRFFEEMPVTNVVSCTSLMVSFLSNGVPKSVIDVYVRMTLEGVSANENTFTAVISACGALDDEFLGHQVLGHVVKVGFEDNLSVENILVSMFGSFGRVEEATSVFHHMNQRDTISWNSLIAVYAQNRSFDGSLRYFHYMRHDHDEINSITLSALLSAFGSSDKLKWGRGVHGLVVKLGFHKNICVCNTLLTMYSESGRSKDTELIFGGMEEKDLISWNSMVAAYVSEGKISDALTILIGLLQTGKEINYVTFTSALSACSDPTFLAEGKLVHSLLIVSGLQKNMILGNALVTMYGKCGIMDEAKKIFQIMPEKELVTWNSLIGGFAENEQLHEAMSTFKLMRYGGEHANYITIINLLGAFSTPSDLLKLGSPLHAHIVQTGLATDEFVKNSLITMYAKCGDLNSSNYIFSSLAKKTSVTWNAMVAANAHHGCWEEGLKLVRQMQRDRLEFDQFSLSAGLAASSSLASMEEGKTLHGLAIKLGFNSYFYVTTATMDMYGKCGEINDVLKMMPEPHERSRLSWNILLSAYSRYGAFTKAQETFHELLDHNIEPDHVTFVSLLSACSHGGLVDEGLAYFNSMTTEFRVPASIEHCVCIVDLLGRSGRLTDAEAFIEKMPVPPNDYIWRSLLAACRLHGHIDLGKKAVENLIQSKPSDDSAYVLYSNLCATSGRWHDVQNVREDMEANKVRKKPACSWVKMKDKVITFGIGDISHPESEQIYEKLQELRERASEAGHVTDTSFSLQDTDEEQKEHNLWNHSERLALAYCMISTPKGSSLRIFKNLRVCGDCHSVFKLVSRMVGRQIILRDPYRFHHFIDGNCSCGDYW
ncbi:hypothetical protein LIER_13784 [Lithospermum erythrorhizon]|uniref:DYW domain-containing protein n=1 Tax=Lithospermum erythrorhizon TaxID=34254 RepID=A0AAV3Q1Y9_LITER